MRYLSPIALLVLLTGPAGASSFAVLEPSASPGTPSIVSLGEPAAETLAPTLPHMVVEPPIPPGAGPPDLAGEENGGIPLSPSIIALGEPAVEPGQVASIGGESRPRNPHLPPMVIRGGIFGDPFVRAGQGQAAGGQASQQISAAPQNQGQPQEARPEAQRREPPPRSPTAPAVRPE